MRANSALTAATRTPSPRRARRRSWLARTVIAASLAGGALALVPGQGTAATIGFLNVNAPFDVKAATTMTVTAKASIYDGPAVRRSCRLTLKEPGGRLHRIRAVRRFRGDQARLGWRVPLGLTWRDGIWEARVTCGSGLRGGDTFLLHPARRTVSVDEVQFTRDAGSSSTSQFAWSARVTNPFGYEVREGDMRVEFRDGGGRVVATRNYSDSVTLAAGESAIVGDSVTIEGETPASVDVRVVGDVYRLRMVPTEIRDLRLVVVPPGYEGDDPDLEVRGEAVNASPVRVSAVYMFVTVFDAGGRLLSATTDLFPGALAPGQGQGISLQLGSGAGLVNAAASVSAFWPSTP